MLLFIKRQTVLRTKMFPLFSEKNLDQNVHTDARANTPTADILRGCRHHWAGRSQLVGGPARPLARPGTPGAERPAVGGLGCVPGCGERACDRYGRRWIARRQGRIWIYATVRLRQE
jgi:hypothetical protein